MFYYVSAILASSIPTKTMKIQTKYKKGNQKKKRKNKAHTTKMIYDEINFLSSLSIVSTMFMWESSSGLERTLCGSLLTRTPGKHGCVHWHMMLKTALKALQSIVLNEFYHHMLHVCEQNFWKIDMK